MFLGYGLAIVIGIALGALGGGGSVLTVPLLVYVFGIGMKEAVAMSLVVVGLTSLLGVYRYHRAGNLNLRAAIIFGPAAMIGAALGTEVAFLVTARIQTIVFGVILLLAAILMLRRQGAKSKAAPAANRPIIVLGLIGAAVGFMTGLVGVGGGFMYVPALALLAGLEMRDAVGTSLALIVLSCGAGVARYAGRIDLDWQLAGAVTALAFVGVAIGAAVASRLPQQVLRRAFAVLMLLMGGFVLIRGEGRSAPRPAGELKTRQNSAVNRLIEVSFWRG